MLKELCLLNGTSGDEKIVCDYIVNEIKDYCEYEIDNLGSIIALKKEKRNLRKRLCSVLIWMR